MSPGGASYYYHYNPLGSARNVPSPTGGPQGTDTSEPYGAVRTETKNSSQAPTNFMKFAGEYNAPTGLYYLRSRQYDPATGRFNRVDPASGPSVDSAQSSYLYAGDQPTVMVDPSGETFFPSNTGERMAYEAASPATG